MSIFDKFRKVDNAFETLSKTMGEEIISLYSKEINTPFEETIELERQILAVYFFGMSNRLMQHLKLEKSLLEIIEIIKKNLVDVFRYSNEQAKDFLDNMVENLQSKDPKNTQYVIINRGLDGYFSWEKGQKENVIKDVCQIINVLKGQ